ncbi:MAG: rRNA maturation RNase YbeY [Cyclobacteriaceae bacterium]|jgi:probable rRNA maturation factor|nr:rRNA maturation RNase YbeY [Cytophagales bacterium]MCZ8328451.1 rRNA maturation RNase YbeY [Cyclobacteriaceae bacterium]
MPSIKFSSENIPFRVKNSLEVKEWIKEVLKKEKNQLDSLQYIFCTDEALLERNIYYLKHYTYTDIITFDLSEKEKTIRGEIYISIDRVKENAQTFKQTLEEELHRVIIHGVLHLCGHGDKTKADKNHMRHLEDYYLKKRKWIRL